eukprot:scaffold3662_cov99-Skeletonema_marinoi.AAC.4
MSSPRWRIDRDLVKIISCMVNISRSEDENHTNYSGVPTNIVPAKSKQCSNMKRSKFTALGMKCGMVLAATQTEPPHQVTYDVAATSIYI